MIPKLLVAAFLLAHAAIHASYIAPRPAVTAGGPQYPFDLGRSWLLTPVGLSSATTRLLGIALIAVTLAGFGLAAMALLVGLQPLWVAGVVIGAVASIALLGVFFHPWLVLGIAIDIALVYLVAMADWQPA